MNAFSKSRSVDRSSTGSHSFELVDVRAFARLARARGAKSVIDNTCMYALIGELIGCLSLNRS